MSVPFERGYRAAVSVTRTVEFFLLVFVASVPFESAWQAGTAEVPLFSISRITGLALLLACLLRPRPCLLPLPRPVLYYLAYLWVTLVALVLNGGERAAEALQTDFMLLQMLVLLWIVYSLCTNRAVFNRVIMVLELSISVLAVSQIFNITSVKYDGLVPRTSVFSEDPNTVGAVLAIGFLANVWSLTRAHARWRKAISGLSLPLIGVALAQTGSRSAVVALAAGLCAVIIMRRHGLRSIPAYAKLAAVAAVLIIAIISTPTMIDRLQASIQNAELAERQQIWSSAVDITIERPLLGWGTFHNFDVLGQRTGYGFVDTHNLFLLILTQVGLIGAIPYLLGLAGSIRGAWIARRDAIYGIALPLLTVVLLVNCGITWHNRKLHWLILALALAAANGLRERRQVVLVGHEKAPRWHLESA